MRKTTTDYTHEKKREEKSKSKIPASIELGLRLGFGVCVEIKAIMQGQTYGPVNIGLRTSLNRIFSLYRRVFINLLCGYGLSACVSVCVCV